MNAIFGGALGSMRKLKRQRLEEGGSVEAAMGLMARRSWSGAARQFRVSGIETALDSGVEMQHGHALKEAGFLSLAKSKYEASGAKGLKNADYFLQVGHLCKVAGDFTGALESYGRALELSRASDDFEETKRIREFLEPVRRLSDQMNQPPEVVDFFISSAASGIVRSVATPRSEELGRANYSYAFAAQGFAHTLEDLGYFVNQVEHPEYRPAPQEVIVQKPVHICFAPPSLARVMKGAYNVIHFAWEFSRIPSDGELVSPHPFDNWVRMLEAFDEVWLPSQYAVSVIAPLITKPVRWMPTPIISPRRQVSRRRIGNVSGLAKTLADIKWVPLSIFPRLQGNFANHAIARSRTTPEILRRAVNGQVPKIFLTILNPHDRRKQLKPLIEAFCEFAASDPHAILLIKTSSPDDTNETINNRLLSHQIAEDTDLVHPYVSDQVWIFNGALTQQQLHSLYGLASFFVCTAFAEGQNLPLLEAMATGCVPVSVDHTAMADYITHTNAVVIESEQRSSAISMRRAYQMFDDFKLHTVSPRNVLASIKTAVQLDDEQYFERSKNAIETVEAVFGRDALRARVSRCCIQEGQI